LHRHAAVRRDEAEYGDNDEDNSENRCQLLNRGIHAAHLLERDESIAYKSVP
jgi:hypothetical protein